MAKTQSMFLPTLLMLPFFRTHRIIPLVFPFRIQRIFFFPHLVQRWSGPMSVTVYLKSHIEKEQVTQLLAQTSLPRSITFSFYITKDPTEYPYNKLRNIALSKIVTSHFWVMDMDMWPCDGLYESLHQLDSKFLNDDHLAVIVPSFEYVEDLKSCEDFESCVQSFCFLFIFHPRIVPFIPHTLEDLRNCMAVEKCDEFRKKYFVHVSTSFVFHSELSHSGMVFASSQPTHVRSLLSKLQTGALCDGEALFFPPHIRRALCELWEG